MSGAGVVLDASAALSWCFEDEWTPSSDVVLEVVRADGAVVPPLWDLEIANVLAGAERRGRISAAHARHLMALLGQLPIEVSEHDHGMSELLAQARTSGLSAYDACYLLTAMTSGLPLATLEIKLREAARAQGVTCLP
ncbi:Death on curing protein, Doc toxin [Serinicoccus hydrothermalis]|uniref:Death on curing protein, Doc toxin n=1 Tax=Serinicoccus hydrothermalis TaxID=1758689 RepID=A0A1B1NE22_9MICO|nr:type II toxin-antitoxin system VapC family toxin [Serinicoccus hydrothermalis]ANS79682.1 Death on curing protein, Doc toxin [Serinicoccus hydrothermalis]